MTQYFEDVEVGEGGRFGTYAVTREEIVEFAERYDPQPIHVDEDAAAETMFGGLVASGWHTASTTMRVLVDEFFPGTGALAAIGIDELRFPAPVQPGDTLSVETEVVEKEGWDDERGLVHAHVRTLNQDDDPVLTMTGLVLWERR